MTEKLISVDPSKLKKEAKKYFENINKIYLPEKNTTEISDLSKCEKYEIAQAENLGDSVLLTIVYKKQENIYKTLRCILPSRYDCMSINELKLLIGNFLIYKGKIEGEDIIRFEVKNEKECDCDCDCEINFKDESGEESDDEDDAKKHLDFYS